MNPSNSSSQRLLSIDALRGFDMLLISGAGSFILLLHGKTDIPLIDAMALQMEHPDWHGFTFYDFIFPLFLFLAGVSLSFSLNKGLEKGIPNQELYRKSARRMLILICLGILYKNAPLPVWEPSNIRIGSVLGRIGFAGFVTSIIYLTFSFKSRLLWIGGILLGYYAALFLIPVPGYGPGDLSFEGNLVGWFDRTFMPGRLLQKTYDELAILTQFPALCLTILGSLTGDVLRGGQSEKNKMITLIGGGMGFILLGLIWGLHFPINKHLWSSSFILLTGGMAILFMTAFYVIIDVWGYRKWAFFFQVIGLNSLVIYLVYRFVDFRYSFSLLFEGFYRPIAEPWHDVFQAFGAMLLVWLFLFFLYRQKIFIKV